MRTPSTVLCNIGGSMKVIVDTDDILNILVSNDHDIDIRTWDRIYNLFAEAQIPKEEEHSQATN